MKVNQIVQHVERSVRTNAPTILSGFGIGGVAVTAYLAAKAAFLASRVIDREDQRVYTIGADSLTRRDQFDLTWKLYIPAVISGALTVTCIIGGVKAGTKKTAAAYSLLTVSEKAFDEYKEKVIEQIGVKKEQAVRDSVAKDLVAKNPPPTIVIGGGTVLCLERHTGRYFMADMETLRKAENTINAQLFREDEATLSDFHHLVGLPPTSHSSAVGWRSDKLFSLDYSTVMSDDGRPCIAFDYSYIKSL